MARRKLNGRVRTWTDSEDIVTSVYMRLDKLLQEGILRYEGFDDIWPLIQVIAERRAIDRNRLASNTARLLSEEPDQPRLVQVIAGYESEDASELLVRLLARISSGDERLLMLLILRGVRSDVAGEMIGISATAARTRWSRLRRELADFLREDEGR